MRFDITFIVLLIAHVLGDFYFQSNRMAKNRKLLQHGTLYALACFGTVCLFLNFSPQGFLLALIASLCHVIIDILKRIATARLHAGRHTKTVFWADQALHVASLSLVWLWFGQGLALRPIFAADYAPLMRVLQTEPKQMVYLSPVLVMLAVLVILKPIDVIIEKGHIWNLAAPLKKIPTADENENTSVDIINEETANAPVAAPRPLNAGQAIGYLERIIVFVLILLQQYAAIAFVLTAKSLARYEKITSQKMTADYYLIGTLLSVVSVFVVTFFLGL